MEKSGGLDKIRTATNKVLPKVGLTHCNWADGRNSTYLILLSGSAENPDLGNTHTFRYKVQNKR